MFVCDRCLTKLGSYNTVIAHKFKGGYRSNCNFTATHQAELCPACAEELFVRITRVWDQFFRDHTGEGIKIGLDGLPLESPQPPPVAGEDIGERQFVRIGEDRKIYKARGGKPVGYPYGLVSPGAVVELQQPESPPAEPEKSDFPTPVEPIHKFYGLDEAL